MAQSDITELQLARLNMIRKQFGKDTVKTYRVDKKTGVMTVTVKAQAGFWQWRFNRYARMIDNYFQPHLDTRSGEIVAANDIPDNAKAELQPIGARGFGNSDQD